ncbi:MAG: hypothetical protein M2R45_05094 [Verrucomicrobia subdivision 3 bacterium]|nr:hypothetical protein [Limisphaerales bacterium]
MIATGQYQHEQPFRGSGLRKVAKEYDIPRESVCQIYTDTQETANLTCTDQTLSDAQRQAAPRP